MQYTLRGGIVIKTENAAKPSSQTSKSTLALLRNLPPVDVAVDYGCGKARYVPEISARASITYLIDSEVQLFREQSVHGRKTSVANYYARSNSVDVLTVDRASSLRRCADRVFCLNVLSAIPCLRSRAELMRNTKRMLRSQGELIVSVQYNNSDFRRMASLPNARAHLDGFLIDSRRGWSFYGLINPDRLVRLVRKHGFRTIERFLDDGTVFVRATA